MKISLLIIFLSFFIPYKTFSSPVGKGLSCFRETDKGSDDFKSFRGIYFESDKNVRVVSFKNKNNSLKVISKQTPYKVYEDKIKFKIKFIWYGEISFEYFTISRNNLDLTHKFGNKIYNLGCTLVVTDFMSSMNNIKSKFQKYLNENLKSNSI